MTTIAQESSITTGASTSIAGEGLNTGGSWVKHAALSASDSLFSDGAGNVYCGPADQAYYYPGGLSNSANHRVSVRLSQIGGGVLGVVCRLNTAGTENVTYDYNGATDIHRVYMTGSGGFSMEFSSSAGLLTLVAGNWLHLDVNGSTVTAKAGSSSYASATTIYTGTLTAGYPTTGVPGVMGYQSSSVGTTWNQWLADDGAAAGGDGDPPQPLVVGDARARVFQKQHNDYYAPIFISTVGSEVEPSISFFSHFNVFGLPQHFQQDATQRFLADRLALQIIKAREAFVLPPPKWTAPILIVGPDSRYRTQAQAMRYSYTNNVHVTPTASYTPPVTPPSTLRSKKKGFFFEIWP